jgi:hypothetical protein
MWTGPEYDCGYDGGVNWQDSKTEYQPGTSSDEPESDAESLDELSGDELEWNIQQQRELLRELATLTRPTPYSQIRDQAVQISQMYSREYVATLFD